jgi:hypothetical protein
MQEQGLFARSRGHLDDNRLGYFAHMRVAFGIGANLFAAGAACIVHGLVPGLCTDRASRLIRRMAADLDRRVPHAPGPPAAAPQSFELEAEAAK